MKKAPEVNDIGLQGTKDIPPFYPTCLADAEEVLTALLNGEIIVDVSQVKQRDKQRFLDLLCGACFCLNKGICPLKNDAYLIINK